jgi:hypothetical protein
MLLAQGQHGEGSFICVLLVALVLAAWCVLIAHRNRPPDPDELRPTPAANTPRPEIPGASRGQASDPEVLLAGFRIWRWVMVLGFLSALPMVALGFPLGLPFGLSGLPSCIAFGYGMSRVYDFRCPRCGDYYVRSSRWLFFCLGDRNEFTSKCIHCGFPKTPR